MTITEFKNNIISHGLEYYGRYYGFYLATVTNNNDPEQKGRLMLLIPQIGDTEFNVWINGKGFFSGQNTGFVAIPKVNDTVLVSFCGGDVNFPIWEYCNLNEIPKAALSDYPNTLAIQSHKGHSITINDNTDTLRIAHANGTTIEIQDGLINIGKVGRASQPILLGDTTVEKLDALAGLMMRMCDAIGLITATITPSGITSVPLNSGVFIALKQNIELLKQTFESTKSQIVRTE